MPVPTAHQPHGNPPGGTGIRVRLRRALTNWMGKRVAVSHARLLVVATGILVTIPLVIMGQLAPTGRGRPVILRVAVHQDRLSILRRLEAGGAIRSARWLDLVLTMRGSTDLPEPGTYSPSGRSGAIATWDRLLVGDDRVVIVTVPEGWSVARIDAMLARKGHLPAGAFLRETRRVDHHLPRHSWLADPSSPATLEGYCFPDTYFLPPGPVDVAGLVDRMLGRFEKAVREPYLRTSPALLPLHEALTLASIVEMEAARPQERAHIAGVFYNRLARGIRLGSDPTVEYALGRHQDARGLRHRDIAIDSPYNTYRVAGLPPGPICNPGQASFEAVLQPERTDDLYFVARGEGWHVFTRTYRDHLAAIREIRGR